MTHVHTTASLRTQGFDHEAVRTNAQLTRFRRGAYTRGEPPRDPVDNYLALVDGTYSQLRRGGVLSHTAAAALHRLPVPVGELHRVHVTRPGARTGFTSRYVQVRPLPLDPTEVTEIDGWPVTSLLRTLGDIATIWPLARTVAAGDAALRLGLDPCSVSQLVENADRRPGSAHLRRALSMLDRRAESPGESISRVLIELAGLPTPHLQRRFTSREGVDYPDFFWDLFGGVIGEFDGYGKYGQADRTGAIDPARTAYDEKLREDRLRRQVDSFVRWGWSDLLKPDRFLSELARALGHRYRPLAIEGIV